MCNRKTTSATYYCSIVVFSLAATSHAATIFFDDFEDGDHLDGMPVTWDITGSHSDDEEMVVDGSLVISSGGINGGYNFAGVDIVLTDTSIRTQATAGPADTVSVGARNELVGAGYYAAVAADGEVAMGARGAERIGLSVYSEFRPEQEDLVLQLDIFGNQLSFWVWRPGESMPDAPLVAGTHDRDAAGFPAIGSWNWPWSSEPMEGVYRYVHVADVHIHPGDFNNGGSVDGDDFLTWQQGYGTQSGAAPADGDADYDGDVDGDDFLVWQREFRTTAMPTAEPPPSGVPEPSTLLLCGPALGLAVVKRFGARNRNRRMSHEHILRVVADGLNPAWNRSQRRCPCTSISQR